LNQNCNATVSERRQIFKAARYLDSFPPLF